MGDKALATVNMDMLNRAVQEDTGSGSSVMDKIHTVKIYNPKPGDAADPAYDGMFIIKPAGGGEQEVVEGPVMFNPISVTFFHSGEIYPIDQDGIMSDDKIFFTTSEFNKFTKKTDVIGLAAKGKGVGFFTKGDFEEMIRSPRMNGGTNQFYERKKAADGKPYDSSYLSKGCMVYGKFSESSPYHPGEFFRMKISTSAFGITFKDVEACKAEPDTFEAVCDEAVTEMNDILSKNGMKTVRRVEPSQIDMAIYAKKNDRGNNLPKFTYEGLVAARGYDNSDDIMFIHNLKNEHFESVFGSMDFPTPVTVEKGNAVLEFSNPQSGPKKGQQALSSGVTGPDAEEVFGDSHEKAKSELDF